MYVSILPPKAQTACTLDQRPTMDVSNAIKQTNQANISYCQQKGSTFTANKKCFKHAANMAERAARCIPALQIPSKKLLRNLQIFAARKYLVCVPTSVCMFACLHICTLVHIYICIYIYMYIIYIHTHIHTHTHIHICTYTYACSDTSKCVFVDMYTSLDYTVCTLTSHHPMDTVRLGWKSRVAVLCNKSKSSCQ
jgi:hypothetical protein